MHALKSDFPGIYITPTEADALRVALAKCPWWSPEPSDFPRLIRRPDAHNDEEYLLLCVLKRMQGCNWLSVDRSYFDQFLFLVVAISASIEMINRPPSEDPKKWPPPIEDDLKKIFEALSRMWGDENGFRVDGDGALRAVPEPGNGGEGGSQQSGEGAKDHAGSAEEGDDSLLPVLGTANLGRSQQGGGTSVEHDDALLPVLGTANLGHSQQGSGTSVEHDDLTRESEEPPLLSIGVKGLSHSQQGSEVARGGKEAARDDDESLLPTIDIQGPYK